MNFMKSYRLILCTTWAKQVQMKMKVMFIYFFVLKTLEIAKAFQTKN